VLESILSLYGPALKSFFVYYVIHVIYWRAVPSNSPRMILLALLSVAGVILSIFLAFAEGKTGPVALFHVLSMDAFLFIFYVYGYAGVCRSVSVTLLQWADEKGRFALSEFVDRYEKSSRLEDRLAVMEKMRWIERTGGQVVLAEKGRRLLKLVRRISSRVAIAGLEG